MAAPSTSEVSDHVLIVEDDPDLTSILAIGLRKEGFIVDVVHDGLMAESLITQKRFDLLIVDWMIPGQDGPTLIRQIRAAGVDVPTLMLTALNDTEKLVEGLDAGADDYLTKPFSFRELVARLKALLRRASAGDHFRFERGPLSFDLRRKTAALNGESLDLRAKEFEILELLAVNSGQDVSREDIASTVWQSALTAIGETTLNMTVSTLRRKLAAAGAGPMVSIKTVRGVGYRLHAEDAERTVLQSLGEESVR